MTPEPDVEEVPKEKPKSKRLSSLIWMLVLWLGVRGCSEMDGISWERAFDRVALMFGLWPSLFFLLLATLPPLTRYQSTFRWAAFFVVLGSIIGGFLFFNLGFSGQIVHYLTVSFQVAMVIYVGMNLCLKYLGKAKND